MNAFRHLSITVALGACVLSGCAAPHGRPATDSAVPAPTEILAFDVLYARNCAGCHGQQGRGGTAISLGDPVYLAIADAQSMRHTIANGVAGTAMPAFAQSAGGLLTDQQIDTIAREIRSRWSRAGVLNGANPPSWAAKTAGDAPRGAVVYASYCQRCHGADGRGGSRGSAITDDSFLALVSDQGLRTMVIVGRPELGAPDWRGDVPGRPMSDQEVTDVVAWLASQRSQVPGQPYSASISSNSAHQE